MKKISTRFLILIILLTFNNTASASFFSDMYDKFRKVFDTKELKRYAVGDVRCKVEYTQLDLNTGLETVVKYTSHFDIKYIPIGSNTCYMATQDFTYKINEWLNESPNNIIVNMTVNNCKVKGIYFQRLLRWIREERWNEYKSCDDEFNNNLVDWLDHPKQLGFNVNKDRLIRDYEEGFENYYGK
jgi:hypothetical protein